MKDSSKTLLSVSELDREIQNLTLQKNEIEKRQAMLTHKLERYRERLAEVDAAHKESATRQALEEHRLKDEEAKIVERRKQLTALGGAKSAKLVERELDIATRMIESMEKSVQDAVASVERLDRERGLLQERVDQIESELSKETEENGSAVGDLEKELVALEKKRDSALQKLNDRLKNLYNKVNVRYPGDAIGIVTGGACRSCYRSLPAQTYNQVMAGNMLLQCPGCSRILIFREEAVEARS